MYDGTTRKIYFDGTLTGSDTPGAGVHAVPANTVFAVGMTNPFFPEVFVGQLDSLGIYSVALTTAQLATLRSLGSTQTATPSVTSTVSPTPTSTPILKAYYGFDSAATLGRDSIGGGSLTVVGTGASYVSAGFTGGALSLSGSTYLNSTSGLPSLPVGNSPYTIVLMVKMAAACNGSFIDGAKGVTNK